MAPRVHVLIVGAGPTGLALALVLRRHGIGCRLVDKAPGPPNTSRALAIQPRTLELLDSLGVGAPILERSVRLRALNVHARGRRIARLSLAGLDSRHSYIVSLEQSETERMLAARLADLGAAPERPVELVRFGQDGGGVRAILRHEGGREETQACDWLIGCDGAHSAVRHGLGLDFQGARYEDDFRLADVRVDWPLPHDEVHVFLHPRCPLASVPLPGGLHRLVAIVPGRGRGEGLAPTLSFFQELARDAAPPGTRVSDATWLASFRVHRRMVNRYRIGRVLLAGDAAHIHSPAGGQGMNIGIADAVNLGWKLALVAAGRADERLLDSYEAERLPIARAVLRATDLATRLILWRGPLAHAVRAAVARRVLGRSRIASRLAPAIAGLAVAYTRSPIVEGRTRAIA
ncbi:MAG: FAD-dependent monooxygenase, partial [Alphaproteobacteria bacterium]